MPLINIKILTNVFFILYFFIKNYVKTDDSDDHRYYFQLYPSANPSLLNVYLPNRSILTINSTDGENPKIIENKPSNENIYKNLSKVMVFNNTLIVKTCFDQNKIVEIIDEKNETLFIKKNNNNQDLSNFQFCYSTAVYNKNKKEYEIVTYWTEKSNNKILHNLIKFNPKSKESNETNLLTYIIGNTGKKDYKENIYPKSCTLFRQEDIYCSFDYAQTQTFVIYGYYFIIETNDIDLNIKIVRSSSFIEYKNKHYDYKPISVGLVLYQLYDIYITEYHDLFTTRLIASLYDQKEYKSKDYMYQDVLSYLGMNVDGYTDSQLFNNLVPNMNDLIIIYLKSRRGNKMSLSMTRYNIISSATYNIKLDNIAATNYYRDDICLLPKYMQSVFINSFIKYTEKDKQIMSNNKDIAYYKYQKDIISFIACSDGDKINYESKKIIMPQCMNILDEINGLNYHVLTFQNNISIIDIYNDPKFYSLRDISIQLIYDELSYDFLDIEFKSNDSDNYIPIKSNMTFHNITHIKFNLTEKVYLPNKNSLSISYRLFQKKKTDFSETCLLSSDFCHFNFDLNDSSIYDCCNIKYCIACNKPNNCSICNKTIYELLLQNNECICNENYNFSKYPNTTIDMCVCKKDYSFYQDTQRCLSNDELENGPYAINTTEIRSGIPIYDMCHELCKKCYQTNGTDEYMFCLECYDGYILNSRNNCVKINETVNICEGDSNNIIELKYQTWFKLGDYKLYYNILGDCVLIYHSNHSLFFVSNITTCLSEIVNKSSCLEKENIDLMNFKNEVSKAKEYNTTRKKKEIEIKDKMGNISFYLVNSQREIGVSDIFLSDECIKILKEIYDINYNDLLVYKADIRRNDTISTQVEYKFYHPEPKKIYIGLDLGLCQNKNKILRRLDDDEVLMKIYVPVNWNDNQKEIVNYVYGENNIFMFDPEDDFYNKVCYNFTTKNGSDIYIQDRKDYYFIDEGFCEKGCKISNEPNVFKESEKLVCNCTTIKTSTEGFESVEFPKMEKDKFNKKQFVSNILMLQCYKSFFAFKNLGLYSTVLAMLIYFLLYLFIIIKNLFCGSKYYKPFKKLRKEINSLENKNKKPDNKNRADDNGDESDDDGGLLQQNRGENNKEIKNDFNEENDNSISFNDYNNSNESNNNNNNNNNNKDLINKDKDSEIDTNINNKELIDNEKNKDLIDNDDIEDSKSIEKKDTLRNLIDKDNDNISNKEVINSDNNINKNKKNKDLVSNENTEDKKLNEQKITNHELIEDENDNNDNIDNKSNINKKNENENNNINTFVKKESNDINLNDSLGTDARFILGEEDDKNDKNKNNNNNKEASMDNNKENNKKILSDSQKENIIKDKNDNENNGTVLSLNNSKKSKNLIDESNEKYKDNEDKEEDIINVQKKDKNKTLKGTLNKNPRARIVQSRIDAKKPSEDTNNTKQLIDDNNKDNNQQNNDNSDKLSNFNIMENIKNINKYDLDSQCNISNLIEKDDNNENNSINQSNIISSINKENENDEKRSEISEAFDNILKNNNNISIEKEKEKEEEEEKKEKKNEEDIIEEIEIEDLENNIAENNKKENEESKISVKDNFTIDSDKNNNKKKKNNSKKANPPHKKKKKEVDKEVVEKKMDYDDLIEKSPSLEEDEEKERKKEEKRRKKEEKRKKKEEKERKEEEKQKEKEKKQKEKEKKQREEEKKQREKLLAEEAKIIIENNDYIKDIYDITDVKKDDRKFCQIYKSLISINSTILFVFKGLCCCEKCGLDINDFFTKITLGILSICFYLIINLISMFNSSILHLYVGEDFPDSKGPIHFVINLVGIPLIAIIPISFWKRYISVREYIYVYNEETKIIKKNYNNKKLKPGCGEDPNNKKKEEDKDEKNKKTKDEKNQKTKDEKDQKEKDEKYKKTKEQNEKDELKYSTLLKLHIIQTKLSKLQNENRKRRFKIFMVTESIILFTGYYTSTFLRVYKNSISCLTVNTLLSLLSSIIVYLIMLLISTIFRQIYNCCKCCCIIYYLSRYLNPSIWFKSEECSVKEKEEGKEEGTKEQEKNNLNKVPIN